MATSLRPTDSKAVPVGYLRFKIMGGITAVMGGFVTWHQAQEMFDCSFRHITNPTESYWKLLLVM